MKKLFILLPLICAIALYGKSQSPQKKPLPRTPLQQRYIISAFITPQLKKGPLKIINESQIDSIFHEWESGWSKVSADSMANNPTKLTKEEFNNIDNYCYFWGLASMTQDLDVGDKYGSILVAKYMVPSLRRDLEMIKRLATRNVIDELELNNTFAIGSDVNTSREAFLATYALYNEYFDVFKDFSSRTDTALSNAAQKKFLALQKLYYVMNARNSYYQNETDKAFNYLVTGLNVDRYSKSRAIDLARKLVVRYIKTDEPDKAYTILNTLAINTTADNLNRDTLQAWYASVDLISGPKMYANLKAKLTTSAFKTAGKSIKLPESWGFVANSIPPEKLKKAKYLLVDYWFTSCGPCIAEIADLNAFYEKIKNREDIVFLSVNTDYENGKNTQAFVAERCKALGVKFPVFYDSASSRLNTQLGITSYPAKVILDVNGQQFIKTDQSVTTVKSFEEFLKENK